MTATSFPKISLIGSGNVGSSLARGLAEKGYPVVSIINRTGRSAIALAKAVKCRKASTHLNDLDPDSEIVIITVADDSLQDIADGLSKLKPFRWKNVFVAHTSGVYSSEVLSGIKEKGALTASMHPIQTFPGNRSSVKFRGIYFGIEGAPDALKKAERIVNDLGAHAIAISTELKPLYHVACVFASSYMVVLLNCIGELAKKLNLRASWTEVFGPLMTSAMDNTVKHSAANALTGPIMRGDFSTISLHLKTLTTFAPQFLPLYAVAGIEVARVAAEHGKINNQDYKSIITQFREFIKSFPESQKSIS